MVHAAVRDMERLKDGFAKLENKYMTISTDAANPLRHRMEEELRRLLAEAQGGRVWVENHPEGGAVFSLALPVWQDEDARSLNPTYR